MEVLEHVPDPASTVRRVRGPRAGRAGIYSSPPSTATRSPTCSRSSAPSTCSRLLPRGTHDYAQFIKPSELVALVPRRPAGGRRPRRHDLQPAHEDLCARPRHRRELHASTRCAEPRMTDPGGPVRSRRHARRHRARPRAARSTAAARGTASAAGAARRGPRPSPRAARAACCASASASIPSHAEYERAEGALSGPLRGEHLRRDPALRRAWPSCSRRSRRAACRGASSPTRRSASRVPLLDALGLARRAPRASSAATPPRAPSRIPTRCCMPRAARPRAAAVPLRRRRPARRPGRARRRHAGGRGRRYGYLGENGDPHAWGADAVIEHPLEVLNHLRIDPYNAMTRVACDPRVIRAQHIPWGRPGFDVGFEAAQGMPRTSDLVNPAGNTTNANDERFALAA